MWHPLWIPMLIPTLIIKSNCDENKTDTAVFVRGGHADAEYQVRTTTTTTTITTITTVKLTTTTVEVTETPTTAKFYEEENQDVVFVPNKEPPVGRDEPSEYYNQGLKVKDIMMMKTVNDAVNKDFHVEKADDAAKEDIVFITGKNHDLAKEESAEKTRRRNNNNNQTGKERQDKVRIPELNCNNLDCNSTIASVCGMKLINNERRYRLFRNDCYFRKVNCAFKYEFNRYKQVTIKHCKNIGSHNADIPIQYIPKPPMKKRDLNPGYNSRRRLSSRRSMSRDINGAFCTHLCPTTCPDDYEPECAMSSAGQKRVFLNHCKMDFNSCLLKVVWYQRPLAECVGHKKADLRLNRGFIGWMQRLGIVDGKGRLVPE